jgi:hypothetical protein
MKMSITRALVELKNLNDRIVRAVSEGKYVAVSVGSNLHQKVPGFVSPEAATAAITGSFDKVEQLISNRQKIKSAIVLSNARTTVELVGKSMTVAEAIEMKSTLDFRKDYMLALRQQLHTANQQVEKQNTALEATIDSLLTTLYGSEKAKISADDAANVSKPQRDQKQATLFDPVSIAKKMEVLQAEIDVLTSEVDFVLSESNAKTEIEVL